MVFSCTHSVSRLLHDFLAPQTVHVQVANAARRLAPRVPTVAPRPPRFALLRLDSSPNTPRQPSAPRHACSHSKQYLHQQWSFAALDGRGRGRIFVHRESAIDTPRRGNVRRPSQRTLSRSRVRYACASARGEPRVPILTVLVATAEATTMVVRRPVEGRTGRGAVALRVQRTPRKVGPFSATAIKQVAIAQQFRKQLPLASGALPHSWPGASKWPGSALLLSRLPPCKTPQNLLS